MPSVNLPGITMIRNVLTVVHCLSSVHLLWFPVVPCTSIIVMLRLLSTYHKSGSSGGNLMIGSSSPVAVSDSMWLLLTREGYDWRLVGTSRLMITCLDGCFCICVQWAWSTHGMAWKVSVRPISWIAIVADWAVLRTVTRVVLPRSPDTVTLSPLTPSVSASPVVCPYCCCSYSVSSTRST